jgi:hypothetical protein
VRLRTQRPGRCTTARAAASSGTGIVIVDHGSRKKESNAMLHEFVTLYSATTGAEVVEPAHMELAEPTIEQAIGEHTHMREQVYACMQEGGPTGGSCAHAPAMQPPCQASASREGRTPW